MTPVLRTRSRETARAPERSLSPVIEGLLAAIGLGVLLIACPVLDAVAQEASEAEATPRPAAEAPPPVEQKVSGEALDALPVIPSKVALARFTTAVENREPVDSVAFLSTDATEIVFFTDLRGLTGETITHRWEHDGKVMAEVSFAVRGRRWRVWSRKELIPEWIGSWTVSVVKSDGEVIAAESFTYSPIEPGA